MSFTFITISAMSALRKKNPIPLTVEKRLILPSWWIPFCWRKVSKIIFNLVYWIQHQWNHALAHGLRCNEHNATLFHAAFTLTKCVFDRYLTLSIETSTFVPFWVRLNALETHLQDEGLVDWNLLFFYSYLYCLWFYSLIAPPDSKKSIVSNRKCLVNFAFLIILMFTSWFGLIYCIAFAYTRNSTLYYTHFHCFDRHRIWIVRIAQ